MGNTAKVIAVHKSATHSLHKYGQVHIHLLEGLGVEGDAHMGHTVKHRSRVAKDPSQPNLRQVHLIHAELFKELKGKGFNITPGLMGENITTKGIDLLALPTNTILKIGAKAQVQITGLRNPCHQLNGIQDGLMKAVLGKDSKANLIRKAGIMGIVVASGWIKANDTIEVQLPPQPYTPLDRV